MGKEHRLGPLHMGITGQDHIFVLFRSPKQRLFHSNQFFRHPAYLPFHVHMKVQSTLVVPAPGSMKPGSGVTDIIGQPFFHIHVDIFQLDGERKLSIIDFLLDGGEAFCDFFTVLFGNDAVAGKHFRMGFGAGNVFFIHPAVIGNGCVEIKGILFFRLGKASAPHHITHFAFFSFIRARMVRGRPKRLMKPSASAWLYTSSSPKVTNSSLYRE